MSEDTAPAVRVRGVVKRFGDLTALAGLDLDVPAGVCFGLLGPNGAGKSTLLSLLTGQAVVTAGTVEVLGHRLPDEGRQARARMGVVPQLDNLDNELSCAENLDVYARLCGVPAAARGGAVAAGLGIARLTDRATTQVEDLSGGMRRRLLVARGLVHEPDLLLLDEPTVGLDPQVRQDLWAVIEDVRTRGVTTILTTHYIEEAERLADLVAVVHEGRLVDLAPPDELVARHVGVDVVTEIVGPAGLQDRVRAAADTAGVNHRPAGTSVALFSDDVPRLAAADTLEPGDLDHRLRRPANLEDVFVTLTGASL